MDREKALAELPTAYAVALRMQADGARDDAIAKALGVPAESVKQLIQIAESKLRALVDAQADR